MPGASVRREGPAGLGRSCWSGAPAPQARARTACRLDETIWRGPIPQPGRRVRRGSTRATRPLCAPGRGKTMKKVSRADRWGHMPRAADAHAAAAPLMPAVESCDRWYPWRLALRRRAETAGFLGSPDSWRAAFATSASVGNRCRGDHGTPSMKAGAGTVSKRTSFTPGTRSARTRSAVRAVSLPRKPWKDTTPSFTMGKM